MNGPTPDHLFRSLARDLPIESVWSIFRDHADPSALRAVLDRLGPRLIERCRLITSDRQLAEDALQEALTRLFSARHLLRTYPEAAAWLYRTATNAARQIARGRRRATYREQAASSGRPERTADSTDTVIDLELSGLIAQAVIDLPENERRAIELVYFEQMTHTDAAAALGWSRGSVGTYVTRGLRRLRGGLSRRGVAVAAVPVVEAALGTAPPLQASDWATVLPRVYQGIDAVPVAPVVGGLMATKLRWAIGLAAVVVIGVGTGIWWSGRPNEKADPPQQAVAETLQERNARITKAELSPRLRELVQRFYPPPHAVELVGVQAIGSEVEIELRVIPPVPAVTGLASRFRGRYCMVLRRLTVSAQPDGESKWYGMDPDRPFALKVPNPFGWPVETIHGREEFAAAAGLFARSLTPDDRAEPDQVRALFGSGAEVCLPSETRGVSGFPGGLVAATKDGGLYVRDVAGQWRAAGACPGWEPVVADGRVYCHNADGILSRPLDTPNAPWQKWCDIPPLQPGEHGRLFLAGGRLGITTNPRGLVSRPVNDPKAEWKRSDHPLGPHVAAVGDTLFGTDGKRLYRRPAAEPDAAWVAAGPWPTADHIPVADGNRLLAYTWGPGLIYSRPTTAGPDVPWEEVGRVHDPYRR